MRLLFVAAAIALSACLPMPEGSTAPTQEQLERAARAAEIAAELARIAARGL